MQARYFKIVLWVSALIVVWQLGRSDVVLNSLFLFAAAGVIPGTNVVLQPNEVFWTLGTLLGVAVLLIFATNLRRGIIALFRRQTALEQVQQPVMAEAIAPVAVLPAKKIKAKKAPKPKIVVVIKPVRRPSKLMMALRVLFGAAKLHVKQANEATAKHFPRVARAIGRAWYDVRFAVQKAALALARVAATAWRQMQKAAFAAGRVLRRELIKLAIYVGRSAAHLWHWAEPHFRMFDYWLGVQYHTYLDAAKHNETVKSVNHMVREIQKVIATARTEVRAALARVVEK
jgi:hypothetical protein